MCGSPRHLEESVQAERSEYVCVIINFIVFYDVARTEFVDILNAMRFGSLDTEAIMAVRQLSREVHYDDGVEPTEL